MYKMANIITYQGKEMKATVKTITLSVSEDVEHLEELHIAG